jgi:SNF2 family DNA or RNA helicase
MCKKQITLSDVYLINKKEDKKENVNPLIEKYGSKLGKVISMIRNLILEPDSRIIIFSQWDFMLSLIGKTLSENGIANCFVKGNVWSRNSAINKFKNGKTLSGEDNKVIMLSLKNAASGTNLTEATHLFFVEPINGSKEEITAIEGQAIGRACRLGQKQKVQLYRVLIKDTIEEEIYNNIYLS